MRYVFRDKDQVGFCLACGGEFAFRPFVAEFWDHKDGFVGHVCYPCLFCEDLAVRIWDRGSECLGEAERLWFQMRQESRKELDSADMPSLWRHMATRPEERFTLGELEDPTDRARYDVLAKLLRQAEAKWALGRKLVFWGGEPIECRKRCPRISPPSALKALC